MLFALDEVANIAPLDELPQIASEGGGQGLLLLAALQDLSQARAPVGTRRRRVPDPVRVKADPARHRRPATLETISVALGEYDREVVSHTTRPRRDTLVCAAQPHDIAPNANACSRPARSRTSPTGHALYLDGVRWELSTLTPAHQCEPWRTLTQPAGGVYQSPDGSAR